MQLDKQKKLILKYFRYFNNKDITRLSNTLSKRVHLKDWEIDVIGQRNVINANKKIFKQFPKIKVTIIKIYYFENTIFAIIKVKLNMKKTIQVIDQFKINKNYLIKEIRAYLG